MASDTVTFLSSNSDSETNPGGDYVKLMGDEKKTQRRWEFDIQWFIAGCAESMAMMWWPYF